MNSRPFSFPIKRQRKTYEKIKNVIVLLAFLSLRLLLVETNPKHPEDLLDSLKARRYKFRSYTPPIISTDALIHPIQPPNKSQRTIANIKKRIVYSLIGIGAFNSKNGVLNITGDFFQPCVINQRRFLFQ